MKWFTAKKDSWQVAQISREGQLVGTRLFRENPAVDRKKYPWVLYFALIYEGNGLPSPVDFNRFDQFEEQLKELETPLGIETVAVMTMDGKRKWIMYVSDGLDAMAALHKEFSVFNPQMETIFDPSWTRYRGLLKMK